MQTVKDRLEYMNELEIIWNNEDEWVEIIKDTDCNDDFIIEMDKQMQESLNLYERFREMYIKNRL